ncbi:MAG: hypothetical protein LBL67_04230 [Coriobacteriales bacterium]|jgi:hypothetical protein|nr:hypothetical protein [Coriobacteriales bacterium]
MGPNDIQILKARRSDDSPDSSVLVVSDNLLKLNDGQEVYAFTNRHGGITIITDANQAAEAKFYDRNPVDAWPPDAAAMARAAW